MPAGWLVGVQAYRVFGAAFLAAALRGTLPGLFGYPAGIGDALTGMFAMLLLHHFAIAAGFLVVGGLVLLRWHAPEAGA